MVVAFNATTMPATVKFVLWLSPTVIESAIVMAMLYRKLWRDLPVFLSYLIFEIGRTLFLFAERKNPGMYFYGYWVTEALGCLAALWVIKELFDNAFSRHFGLRKLGNVLFQWSILMLLVSAVLIAWLAPGTEMNKLMAGIFVLKRTVTFVEFGLLGFLFLFAFAFGLAWQHYATGVALGFAIYGAVEAVAIMMRLRYGHMTQDAFNFIMMAVNNCCVLVWAAYFLKPAPDTLKQGDLATHKRMLEEWNEGLLQLLKR